MNVLAFDIGRVHSGCATADTDFGVPFALPTIVHTTDDELLAQMCAVADARDSAIVILGLPLHTSGTEGEEAVHVRSIGDAFTQLRPSCTVEYLDERFTSRQARGSGAGDEHAASAIILLETWLRRQQLP